MRLRSRSCSCSCLYFIFAEALEINKCRFDSTRETVCLYVSINFLQKKKEKAGTDNTIAD